MNERLPLRTDHISTAGSNQSAGCLAASANAQFRLDNLRPLAQAWLGRWAVRFLVSAAALLCQMVRRCIARGILMGLTVEIEREEDGRWIAEVPQLPGVLAYGQSREEAIARAQALALRVIAERLEHGEAAPGIETVFSVAA